MSPEIFDYLFLCSKYQHLDVNKQMACLVCNIGTQCNMQQCQDVYLLHTGDNSDLLKLDALIKMVHICAF